MAVVLIGPLKTGSTGASVKALQSRLNIASDGQFGTQTDAAVRTFQKSKGLTSDGIVGPKTAVALGFLFQPAGREAGPIPPPPPSREGRVLPVDPGRPNQNAAAQLLEAVAQGIGSLGARVAAGLNQLGEDAAKAMAFLDNSIRQVAGFLRSQAASFGQVVDRIEAKVSDVVRRAFSMMETALQRVAALLVELTGLDAVANFIQLLVQQLRTAVNTILDVVVQWLKGLFGPLENFISRLASILSDVTSGLPGLA